MKPSKVSNLGEEAKCEIKALKRHLLENNASVHFVVTFCKKLEMSEPKLRGNKMRSRHELNVS
jgi:hypothetical protein